MPAWRAGLPAQAQASLRDRDRVCPCPAGPCLVDGSRFIVRLPAGDLVLSAPQALLKRVFTLCDGCTTWNEVLAKIKLADRDVFDKFLTFLFSEGAFVDSVQLTKVSAGYAFEGAPMGIRADKETVKGIRERFLFGDAPAGKVHKVRNSPLDGFFRDRESIQTFSNAPMTERQLHALVWSAGGVVSGRSPVSHRTMASGGGMHLVRWVVVLQKRVGSYAPGVYEASFPRERELCLVSRSEDVSLFHRAFERPWQQAFASGAIFAVADADVGALRYRNRATQYLFLEAGAGMQNIALTAPPLGLASSSIGAYSETVVKAMCCLSEELVLCSAIFGVRPTNGQRQAVDRMLPINFEWVGPDPQVYPLPFFSGKATVVVSTEEVSTNCGVDADPRMAYVKTHAEAIERQAVQEPRNLVLGALRDVTGAINPRNLAAYTDAQYGVPSFPFKRFDPDAKHYWVKGVDLLAGSPAHVIASFVYRWDRLPQDSDIGGRYTRCSSSGCAAGPTLDFALKAALLEVVERDALMRCWLSQTPGVGIPDKLLPQSTQQRIRNLQAAGCKVTIQSLPAAVAHVAFVAATHMDQSFTCVAGAAREDLVQAVAAALDELEFMVYVRLTGERDSDVVPASVSVPADHASLYCQPRHFRRADALFSPTQWLQRLPRARKSASLQDLLDKFARADLKPAYLDITPQKNCIDQGRTPLTVVKAVVPSLVPISFGFGIEPRGMLAKVDDRSHFPHPFP